MTQLADDVCVGDELEPFSRRTDLANWNRYAAVNEEFVPYHMDDEAGRAAGYSGAFGMGNLQWAYLHCLLRQWIGTMGQSGRILSISCQFRAPNTRGMQVAAQGVVRQVHREPNRVVVDLEIWLQDQDGNKLAPGTASVELYR